jgi:hypothetical protein
LSSTFARWRSTVFSLVKAPLAPLSVAVDAVHLTAVSLWVGGLPWLVAVLLAAPRALPDGGGGSPPERLRA